MENGKATAKSQQSLCHSAVIKSSCYWLLTDPKLLPLETFSFFINQKSNEIPLGFPSFVLSLLPSNWEREQGIYLFSLEKWKMDSGFIGEEEGQKVMQVINKFLPVFQFFLCIKCQFWIQETDITKVPTSQLWGLNNMIQSPWHLVLNQFNLN